MAKTVLVCEAQVPFVHGGAELLVRGLVAVLIRRGYRAQKVSIPFKWYPKDELLAQAAAWQLVDLSEANGVRIDTVIATKFPTYFVRHPNKVTWLLHQYRAIYDLCGTPYSEFTDAEPDVRLRDRLIALDNEALAGSSRLFTIADNTTARLARYNGIAAETLYHPPPLAGRLTTAPPGDYVFSVGRLEANKRVDLIVRALAHADRRVRLIVAGEGPLRDQLEALAVACGVADRVTFTGRVTEAELIALYAGALAVVFPPFDEDYGYVTLEAFLSRKPVVTICDPSPESIGAAITRLAADPGAAQALGDAGYERARTITWDGVVDKLMADG
jgi:glycosyltransferase involved in cell wall biosynthesis